MIWCICLSDFCRKKLTEEWSTCLENDYSITCEYSSREESSPRAKCCLLPHDKGWGNAEFSPLATPLHVPEGLSKMFSYFNSTVKFVQGLSLHRFSPWDHLGTFSNFPKLLTFSILIKCTINYRRLVLSVSTHRKGVTFVNLYQLFEPFNSRSQCAICHLILRRHHRLLHSSEVLNYLERFLVQLFINVVK